MASDFGIARHEIQALAEEPKEKAIVTLETRYGGPEGLAKALRVDVEHGLNSENAEDLQARRDAFGENRIPVPPQRSLLMLMWDALHDLTLIILLIAGLVSLIIGVAFEEDKATGWIEGAAIIGAVFCVVFVSSVNDFSKEKQFRKLNAVKEDSKVNVFRDGAVKQVSKYDVLVGDIVLLAQGDELVADGIVFEASSLTANEAALTGESDDIKKNPKTAPFVFSGTQIMDGVGKMIVTAVGEYSQAGIIHMLITGQAKKKPNRSGASRRLSDEVPETTVDAITGATNAQFMNESALADNVVDLDKVGPIAASLSAKDSKGVLASGLDGVTGATVVDLDGKANAADESDDEDLEDDDDEEEGTVLQRKLERLAVFIGYVGLCVGVLTFLVLLIRFCIETYTVRGWEGHDFQEILDYFIIGITVLVVAIPEGLPLAVTLALAFSMTQMIKENNLVRHLDACETMGSATTICSDKTGTLTTNRMTVVEATVGNTETQGKSFSLVNISDDVAQLYKEGAAVNSTAEVQPPASGVGVSDHIGSKTECALLQYAMDMGANYTHIRQSEEKVHMAPFSSAKKRMSTIVKTANGYRMHMKGASEIVLGLCTKYISETGQVAPLTSDHRKKLLNTIENYASQSLRTLCLAYRDVDAPANGDWDSIDDDKNEGDMTMLILVGIEDPVRPEVPGAIEACRQAGVTVRMVTGDNVITARAIAKKCGILNEARGDLVMEGPEFRAKVLDEKGNIKQDVMDQIWPQLRVLARSSPTDKYTLVSGILGSKLNKDREVVAVTGDGTNDAPALKRADIGFAMGIQGTSVAKNASDIILMDDNFSSIVVALKWGRNVYDSIAKFVQFQLTVNVCALVVSFVSAAVTKTTPLTAVQLLWVNLIMDTLAALALATERPSDDLLYRKPYGRDRPIVSRRMWWFIINHAIYQMSMLFFVQYAGASVFNLPESGMDADGKYPTQHYTMVFNTFVLCQLFNEINARKLHGEWNVFGGIFTNPYFIGIMVFQYAFQILIVEFGGRVFMTTQLTWAQWGWCFLMGSGELVWNQIINVVPIMIPKSWRVRMVQPFRKNFWLKSRRRLHSSATRPFRKSMKSNPAGKSTRSLGPRHTDLLAKQPDHMSFYESALRMLVSNSKNPKVRLHATMWLVHERLRSESHLLHGDSTTNLNESRY